MTDTYYPQTPSLVSPAVGPVAIVVSATDNLAKMTRFVRCVSGAGSMTVLWWDGQESIEPMAVGDVLYGRILRIKSLAGLTAADLRAYY